MREVPSIPAGLEPKLRNVLSAVRESLNSAITNINANSEGLNGIRQWIMPAIEANNDLTIFSQAQINAALESATGADGAAGIAARAVSLTTPSQSFTYDTNGANPSPATSVITATVFNTVGVVYYEFFLNDVSTGTATTSNTYTYTPRSAFTGMPDKLEVQIREDGLDGAIEARDQMTMIGLKAGSHGITVMLSNEAHTLPRSTAGVVTYTGSGTKINVWEGTTALTEDSSSPYANSTFRVTTAATGITPGSITGTGTTTLTYGDANSMTTSPAKIDFTIIAKRQDGTEITISKQQSLSYSQAGDTGAGGDAVDLVFVRAASQPATPTASSGTPIAPITWYTDVASVPASADPLWASTGFKASASANYTWDTPVRVEGASVAEVTVFTRDVPTSTPTGGTYTFSNPPVLVVPTSTGATWYTSIPSGTTAVYTSRAVVSTSAGNTSAVVITGWTTPVISFQNGAVLNIDPLVTYSFAGSVPTGAGFTFTLSDCTAASSNGGTSVALTSTTADPYVILSGLSLNPVDNYIIALRVKIPIGTVIDGGLFYANSSHSYIEGVNKLSMAGLIGTGDWQTIVVDASNTTSDWLTGGIVTSLRFDFVSAIATINLAYISIGKYGISKGARATFTTYAAVASAAWGDATAYAAITAMTGSGGVLLVGDEVTLCYPNTTAPTWVLTKYVTAVGNPGTWAVRGQVIDGNLMVTGTLSAASLKTSNLLASNAISVVNASNVVRAKFGNLGTTYGIQGWDGTTRSVFKLDENGLDAKITQSALKLMGCSYHSQVVLEGDYTFTIYGSAVQTVVIPIPISTVGMYQLFARVTAYWENDLYGTASYASHALWREMSMGVYYKNAYTTSGGGNDISKVISMGEVRQGDDTTDGTNFPYTRIKLQVNSVTAANLVVGTDYTITTVGTTNWNTVSGGDLITPYAIGESFRAVVAGTGTGVATTGNPQLSLSNRAGNSTANNTTTFSYTILAVDNKMYPFEVF